MSCIPCSAVVGDGQAVRSLSLTAAGVPVAIDQLAATAVVLVVDEATGAAVASPPPAGFSMPSPGVVVVTFDLSAVTVATTLAYYVDFTFGAELGGVVVRRCVQLRVCTPGDAAVVIDGAP